MRVAKDKRIVVGSVHDHPQLAKMWSERQAESNRAQDEAARITKEMGRVLREEERHSEKFWIEVAGVLKDKLPRDFNLDDYILELSNGTVYCFRKEDVEKSDLQELFEKIFEPSSEGQMGQGSRPHFGADAVVH